MTEEYYIGLLMLKYVLTMVIDFAIMICINLMDNYTVEVEIDDGDKITVPSPSIVLRRPVSIFCTFSIMINTFMLVQCLFSPASIFESYVNSLASTSSLFG